MRRAYYRTWGSHLPPRAPIDEVDYDDAEAWDALYLAVYDGPRLHRFEKIYFERAPVRVVTLDAPRDPGAWIYLAPDPRGEVTWDPSRVVTFADTERLARFGRATVEPDGAHARLYRVERTTPFVDEYFYRPDGTLREAQVTWSNGRTEQFRYDERGERVSY